MHQRNSIMDVVEYFAFRSVKLLKIGSVVLLGQPISGCNIADRSSEKSPESMEITQPEEDKVNSSFETSSYESFSTYACLKTMSCSGVRTKTAIGQYILEAISTSPSVSKAFAEVRIADQRLGGAREAFRPSIGMRAEAQSSGAALVSSIQQPLWSGGRLKASRVAAEAALEAARAQLAITQFEVAQEFVSAFGSWSDAYMAIELLKVSLNEHEEILAAMRRRTEAGISGQNELFVLEARVAGVRSELVTSEASLSIAAAKITSLTGRQIPTDQLLKLGSELPASPEDIEVRVELALASSPYRWLALAEIKQAEAQEAIAKSDRFPTVSIIAENSQSGLGGDRASSSRFYLNVTTNFGPGLSVADRIREAKASTDATSANLSIRTQMIRDEVELSSQRIQAVQGNILAYERVISASEAMLNSYRAQITDTGGKTWQDILSAARELNDARRKQATSKASLQEIQWRESLLVHGLKGI